MSVSDAASATDVGDVERWSSIGDDGDDPTLNFCDDDMTAPDRPPKPPGTADPAAGRTFDSEESLRRESIRWSSLASRGLQPPTIPERDDEVAPAADDAAAPAVNDDASAAAATFAAAAAAAEADGDAYTAAPPLPVDCPEPRCFIAIANFRPRNYDELMFDVGEMVMATKQPEGGWWFGSTTKANQGKDMGWFPSNHVAVPPWGKVIAVKTTPPDNANSHLYQNLTFGTKVGTAALPITPESELEEVRGIEAQIEGWSGEPLSQMCNRLIYDGALLQIPMSSDGSQLLRPKRYGRHFFLFDTLLIWCQRCPRAAGTRRVFRLKGKVSVRHFNVMVPDGGQATDFKTRHSWIVFLTTADKVFRCCPATAALKTKWIESFPKAGINVMGLAPKKAPPTEVNAATMKSSDAERIAIMEQVKTGTLTIDEAMAKLMASETKGPMTQPVGPPANGLYEDE